MAACISASDQEAPVGSTTLVSLRFTEVWKPIASITVAQVWPTPLLVGLSEPLTVSISTVQRRK
ncbi:hypothetical protein D9M70_556700 [compost metagenome]